jgi:hypothetical protein
MIKPKATHAQMQEAKQLIAEGHGPASVSVKTGIALVTAQKLHREYKTAHPDPSSLVRKKPEVETPPANPVASRLMNQAEIEKYGTPQGAKLDDVPKDFVLRVGPVGIGLAAEVVKSTVEAMRILGATDVVVTIAAANSHTEKGGR